MLLLLFFFDFLCGLVKWYEDEIEMVFFEFFLFILYILLSRFCGVEFVFSFNDFLDLLSLFVFDFLFFFVFIGFLRELCFDFFFLSCFFVFFMRSFLVNIFFLI